MADRNGDKEANVGYHGVCASIGKMQQSMKEGQWCTELGRTEETEAILIMIDE